MEVVASIPKLRPSGEKGLGTKGSQQFTLFWGGGGTACSVLWQLSPSFVTSGSRSQFLAGKNAGKGF